MGSETEKIYIHMERKRESVNELTSSMRYICCTREEQNEQEKD